MEGRMVIKNNMETAIESMVKVFAMYMNMDVETSNVINNIYKEQLAKWQMKK